MSQELNYINYFRNIVQKNDNYLVTGCPGTGKSFFLIQFVRYLIKEEKINPDRIIVFTFNRKTSRYYREEISKVIDSSVNEIAILTFHSFCLEFLSRYYANIALKNFFNSIFKSNFNNFKFNEEEKFENIFNDLTGEIKLLTAPQQWELITDILNNSDENNYFHINKLLRSNSYTKVSIIQEIFDYILRAKENLLSPEYLSKKFTPYINELMSEINNIYLKYNEKLIENNLYDYGRILQETESILENDKSTLDYYKQRYKFVLIDDLQEINYAESEIIKKIANDNIVFFGNDDESVYSFRGSNINNYFKIYESLKSENIFFLNENFRNNYLITEISRMFIERNKNRIKKDSKSVYDKNNNNQVNGEVAVTDFSNLHEELNFILSKIYFLNKVKGINLRDIAIILRGSEFETKVIENFLVQNNITYYLRNSRSIPTSKYVKYILNICRLCILINDFNKNNNQSLNHVPDELNNYFFNPIDLLVKNLLFFEFFDMEPLFFKEIESVYFSGSSEYKNIWEFILKNLRHFKKIDKKNYEKLIKFVSLISKYSKKINISSFEFFTDLFKNEKTGFKEKILNYNNLMPSEKNLLKVLNDYLESVKNFDKDNLMQNSVRDYLYYIDKLKDNQFIEEIEESNKDINENEGIRIISFYESKNYEFEAVFIPFLNKGYIPSDFYAPQIYDSKIFQMFLEKKYPRDDEIKKIHEEEERKILYMGFTRAKNYLYVTSNKYKKASPFFLEIFSDLKKIKESFKNKDSGLLSYTQNNDDFNSEIIYFSYLRNKWLLKKKALVSTYRITENLVTDNNKYNEYLLYLNKIYNFENWWNLRYETINDFNPFSLHKNYFSYSSLETYSQCPFKYKHQYLFKIRNEEEKIPLLTGIVYHEVIRRFFQENSKYESGRLLEIFNDEIQKIKNQLGFDFYLKEITEDGIKTFQNFYNFFVVDYFLKNLTEIKNSKTFFCEKKFEFEFGNEDIITGKIDFINIINENTAEIIDFKSSQNKYTKQDLMDELQLKIYKFSSKHSKSLNQDGLNLMNKKINLRYYFLGSEKDPFMDLPDEYYDENDLILKIKKIISNIKDENFEIMPGNYMSCHYCDYKIFCDKYYGNRI